MIATALATGLPDADTGALSAAGQLRIGLEYYTALQVVASSNVFTTHTPVPAGNDAFPREMMSRHFSRYSEDFRMVPQSTEQQPDPAANLPAEPEAPNSAERTDQNGRLSLVRKVRDWLTRAA